MQIPTINDVIMAMSLKGYTVYDNGSDFDVNIVGIRSSDKKINEFNDLMTIFYRTDGEWILNTMPCTTDPGLYWLRNPINVEGTAILKEGQYKGAFRIGLHRGKYKALVQAAPLPVYRDRNKDDVLDLVGEPEVGMFGINIHRASGFHTSDKVGKYSAGCQVLADPFQFEMFIRICEWGSVRFGNSFTYTLLNEKDLK